jgi:hypothetical protein
MSTTARHSLRCSICQKFIATADRETLLAEHRLEWDEALVDEFLATTQHVCVDADPTGAAWMARLADTGQMRPDLRDLIAAALARKQEQPAAVCACGHPKSDHMGATGQGLCIACYPACHRYHKPATQPTPPPAPRFGAIEPEQRSAEQVAADLDWLRSLRANVQRRWGGVYGGHDAHLDTIDYGGAFDGVGAVYSDADPGL